MEIISTNVKEEKHFEDAKKRKEKKIERIDLNQMITDLDVEMLKRASDNVIDVREQVIDKSDIKKKTRGPKKNE